jgi:hypothetical protein
MKQQDVLSAMKYSKEDYQGIINKKFPSDHKVILNYLKFIDD